MVALLFDVNDDLCGEFIRVHLAFVETSAIGLRDEIGLRIPGGFEVLLRASDTLISSQQVHQVLP